MTPGSAEGGSVPGEHEPLDVLVHPHIVEANAYLSLLTASLRTVGVESHPFTPTLAAVRRFDVVHVHWPELVVGPRTLPRALASYARTRVGIDAARARGAACVWTVHNLGSHDRWYPHLEDRVLRWWVRRVDGVIALSEVAAHQVLERYPSLRTRPVRVVRHGHYRAVVDANRSGEPRGERSAGSVRAIHFGFLRPYKGTLELVQQFRRLRQPDARLLVIGRARPPEFGRQLVEAARADGRIELELGPISDERLVEALEESDVALLPYRDVLHSGAVLMALSADRPVLAPALGSLPEVASQVGSQWLRTYSGDLTSEVLERALAWATATRRQGRAPLESYDWAGVAARTRSLYEDAISHRLAR